MSTTRGEGLNSSVCLLSSTRRMNFESSCSIVRYEPLGSMPFAPLLETSRIFPLSSPSTIQLTVSPRKPFLIHGWADATRPHHLAKVDELEGRASILFRYGDWARLRVPRVALDHDKIMDQVHQIVNQVAPQVKRLDMNFDTHRTSR